MPLQKILFKPGVNRENTRYTTEGGWYDCNKIRFRQGNPESIGGWEPYSADATLTFQGVCRALWNWVTLASDSLIALGTNLKYYINQGGAFYNITPIRRTITLGTDPFSANGTTTVTVTDTNNGAVLGDFVTFSGATGTYASILNAEFQITAILTANSYTIEAPSALAAGSYGGAAVVAKYQISVGPATVVAATGWGAGAWSAGPWGVGVPSTTVSTIRLWSQQNYGEDLVFGPRRGAIYYWDATGTVTSPGVLLNTLGGTVTFTVASPTVVTLTVPLTEGSAVQFAASSGGSLPSGISAATTYYLFNVEGLNANLLDVNGVLVNATTTGSGTFSISLLVDVPTVQNFITASDVNRFILAFGVNDYGLTAQDPMLIRWSDQDNPFVWTPDDTNQAGSIRLSHGSEIVTVVQTRQEFVVFTDSSIYSMQYLGPPVVWGVQLLGDNVSVLGQNAAIVASGVVYWMGVDKFYMYDGRVQTLNCDVRRYVFSNFNQSQAAQVYAGTNEGFNEVWWLYCSTNSQIPDKYVVFNYLEGTWYYGDWTSTNPTAPTNRSAWLDSGLLPYPLATLYDSNTKTGRLLYHESGLNDNIAGTPYAINAYISSSEFDIGDGHNFGFVWRVIPDLTFANSLNNPANNAAPQVTMTLRGLSNSGSGQVGPAPSGIVAKGSSYVITEEFTGQIYTRVRGRQMIFEIESEQVNTAWQLGAPRIDIKPDGRR